MPIMFYQIFTTLFFVALHVLLFEVKPSKESDEENCYDADGNVITCPPKDDDSPCLPDEPSAYLGPNMTEVGNSTIYKKILLQRPMHIAKSAAKVKTSGRTCYDAKGHIEVCHYGPGVATFNALSPTGIMKTYLCEPEDENTRCVKSFHFVHKEESSSFWSFLPSAPRLPWNDYTPERIKLANYYTARRICKEYGHQLVSIENEYKWADLMRAFTNSDDYEKADYWTSAFRNSKTGKFWWGNGCPFGFTRWASGEPNNHQGLGGHEDCVEIYYEDLRWNDYPCGGRPPTHKDKGIVCESVDCVRPY